MLSLGDSEVYDLSRTATDMRKGIDVLCGEARCGMGRDPISGEVSIFYNTGRTRLKLLHWERGNLAGVVEKMRDELRQLRRMLLGRKSERFIPSDPSQLKLDFESVAELKEEREYAALQASAPTARKKPAPRIKRPTEERQRRIFADRPERRDEIIEPDEILSESKRIGEAITELLEYKPGELYIRRKYALPGGEGVVIGDLMSLPLPKSNARPSILAQLLVGKYQDHLTGSTVSPAHSAMYSSAFIISKIEYKIPQFGTTGQTIIAVMIRQTMP